MDQDQIRKDQADAARRLAGSERSTLRLPKGRVQPKKGSKPAGHEAYLKGLQESGASIVIMTLAGEVASGKLKHADKYTISLEVTEAVDGEETRETYVYFKHAIEYFRPLTPPPFKTEEAAD